MAGAAPGTAERTHGGRAGSRARRIGSASTPTTPTGRATTRTSSVPARCPSRSRRSPQSSPRSSPWTQGDRRAALHPAVPPLQRRYAQPTQARRSSVVNIDGALSERLKRAPDHWSFDPRLPETEQTGHEIYDKNDLDLGHLTRRLDPAWGQTRAVAKSANDDTFHFTNCTPQHQGLQPQPDELGRARGLHPRKRGQPQFQGDRVQRARARTRRRPVSGCPAPAPVLEGCRHGQTEHRRAFCNGVPPQRRRS